PSKPAHVVLRGLRTFHTGRGTRRSAPGAPSLRLRARRLRRPPGEHCPLGQAPPGLARQTPVGRLPTARPVVSSPGAGLRGNGLTIDCSTIGYPGLDVLERY